MFSIYTSLYNLDNGFIDWKEALNNFCAFADEVVIATLPKDEQILIDYTHPGWTSNHFKLVVCKDISLDDLAFDGKLKNAALKACTHPFCILLDGDERIDVKDRKKWEIWAERLNKMDDIDALFIPVVDLFHSEREYKSLGKKWYMHKNLPNLHRGVVNFARKSNGKIDHTQSDTCELIYNNGNLVRSSSTLYPHNYVTIDLLKYADSIYVWHMGWLDKEKRLKSNSFWQPVWNNRAGEEVKNIIHSKEKLDKIEYFPHGLKLWYE